MYRYAERCIMNLSDHYTLLYGFIAAHLMNRYGMEGERAVREGTRRFGIARGVASRETHLKAGAKINMQSLFGLYHDLPGDPRFRRELQELSPQERVSHTLLCPMADIWKEYGQMHIGRIYCEEFHSSSYIAYAYGYTQVNLARTLTQEGDDFCSFNVVLRPANLPEHLLPACFEEYDPYYPFPVFPERVTTGKDGFRRLSIMLYTALLETALEHFGADAVHAVCDGLEEAARVAAGRLQESASKSGDRLDAEFVRDNIPIDLGSLDEGLWKRYASGNGIEQMKTHFCIPLLKQLQLTENL